MQRKIDRRARPIRCSTCALATQRHRRAGEAPATSPSPSRGPGGEAQEEAGAVVVCTGFQHFDPGRETQMYGYYEYDDVITLADAERC